MEYKKLICAAAGFCLLAACSSGTGENSTAESSGEEQSPVSAEPSAQGDGSTVHWVREPDLKLDRVYELEAVSYWGIPETTFNENNGYPQDWDDVGKPEYAQYLEGDPYGLVSQNEYYFEDSETYTCDAIAVISDGMHGVFDYSGNPLMNPCNPADGDYEHEFSYYPGDGFGFSINLEGFYTGLVSSDFRHVKPGNYGGVGGDPGIGYFMMDSLLYRSEKQNPIADGTAIRDAYGHNCLVQMLAPNADPYQAEFIGVAAYDAQGNKKKELEGLFPLGYVNGYCAMSDRKTEFDLEKNDFVNNGMIALYDMNTCEPITDAVYTGAKYFESGFCPVQKDGKWGYIDETGAEVTDFIFDDASAVYEGKAFVGINGVYGVLDLAETIAGNIPITMETCYPGGIPEGNKPESGEIPFNHIGYAEVKVDNLNTRSIPGTDGEKLGVVFINSRYPVFEIKKDDQYTWYKISDSAWIADQNGNWVEYTEK